MDMDDLAAPPTDTNTESYVVSGWSALERGDLAEARAALQELYEADPAHPALPLLAAGIRRIRPKPVPWRAGVLLLIVVAAGIVAFRAWNSQGAVTRSAEPASAKADVAPIPQSTPPPPPAQARRELGTSGHVPAPELPIVKQNPSSATLDEDVIVRQTIERFAGTYRSRWGGLAFEHCDISRDGDEASAICVPRQGVEAATADSERVWKFTLRKTDGAWKIASVQPPPSSAQ
jgi:hypothetical protein